MTSLVLLAHKVCMKLRPQCMNSGAGAEDYALNPALLFRQIGRVYKVNASIMREILSSPLIGVVLGVQNPVMVA